MATKQPTSASTATEYRREAPPMTARGKRFLLKPLVFGLAAIMLQGCITPMPDSTGRYTSADRRLAGDRQRDALFERAALPRRLHGAQADPYRGRPDRRLHRQVQRRQHRPGRDPGRGPDGDERAGQGRRAAGRTLRHFGRRTGAEIRQQQADHRQPDGQGPGRLSQDLSPARSPARTTTSSAASPSSTSTSARSAPMPTAARPRPTASRARPAATCM